jgi:hypothetical protein
MFFIQEPLGLLCHFSLLSTAGRRSTRGPVPFPFVSLDSCRASPARHQENHLNFIRQQFCFVASVLLCAYTTVSFPVYLQRTFACPWVGILVHVSLAHGDRVSVGWSLRVTSLDDVATPFFKAAAPTCSRAA